MLGNVEKKIYTPPLLRRFSQDSIIFCIKKLHLQKLTMQGLWFCKTTLQNFFLEFVSCPKGLFKYHLIGQGDRGGSQNDHF